MLRKISKLKSLSSALSSSGLNDYSNLVMKIAADPSSSNTLVNTSSFFNDLKIKINSIIRNEERRGNTIMVEKFNDLLRICLDLKQASVDGDFKKLDRIFSPGTEERKLSATMEPGTNDLVMNHNGLGYSIGMDIIENSLSKSPIENCTRHYIEGEEEGIKRALSNKISSQKNEFDRSNFFKRDLYLEEKKKLLKELSNLEIEMEKRQNKDDPNNYSVRPYRGGDKEWYEETVFRGVSPEEASRRIEEKKAEIEEKLRVLSERYGLDAKLEVNLTPQQKAWAKFFKIEI